MAGLTIVASGLEERQESFQTVQREGSALRSTPEQSGSAASEVFSQDSVELSGQTLKYPQNNGLTLSYGSYSLSASIQYLSLNQSASETPDTNASFDFNSLHADVESMLGNQFGTDSKAMQNFGELSDRLMMLDGKLYQAMLIMMKMAGEESPERAASMMKSFEGIADLMEAAPKVSSQSGGVFQSTSLKLDIEMKFARLSANMPDIDGMEVDAESKTVSLNITFENGRIVFGSQEAQVCDPLVLDLAGNGINLRGADEGVDFDLTGDGRQERTAFIQGDDALLFLDKNGNGTADNGRELFGDQEGHANGFAELAEYDDNGDGLIDAADLIFRELRLFQDKNGDGINQLDEVLTLEEAGIESLNVGYTDTDEEDGKGNRIAQKSSFTRTDGRGGLMADALLKYYG
jgi:hypothetical protein